MLSHLRILGSSLILAASILLSLTLVHCSRKREAEYDALCALLRHIRDNIDCFMTPIGTILESFNSEPLKQCGFSRVMCEEGLSAAAASGFLSVSDEAVGLLIEFADGLGIGLRDEEMRRCEYYFGCMRELAEAEHNRAKNCAKLYMYLPPLAALSLIIVLI